MVGLSQLRAWQPDLLADAGTAVAAANRAFGDAMQAAESHVDTAMSSWHGTAAAAASSRSASEQEAGRRLTTAVTAQADALADAAASIGPARLTALSIADEAIASGFAVADDGRASAPPFISGNPVADLLIQAQLGEQAAVLEARLMPALATVGELDARAGAALDAATAEIDDSFNSMVKEANALKSETETQLEDAGRGDETVASIAWLGYEPPQTTGPGVLDLGRGALDVAQTDRANAGAANLAGFYDGLDVASTQPDPHITALGHSYGSLTTGLALQDPGPGQPVDDAVFYGSPGINADDESDLGLAEGHGYVMEADEDRVVSEIGKTHRFGPDPSTADFEQLSTDAGTSPDGVTRDGVHSHSQYSPLGDNNQLRMSGYNMASIVAGLPEQVVR